MGAITSTDRPVGAPAVQRRLTIGGQPAELAVSGPVEAADRTPLAAATLAALCAAALGATCRSALRWRGERQRLYHDDHLLGGAFDHQQRVEADLRTRDTQLRAVLESTPDTVALLEPSQQRCRLLNRSDLLGHVRRASKGAASSCRWRRTTRTFDHGGCRYRLPTTARRTTTSSSGRHRPTAVADTLHLRVAALRGTGLSLQHRCVGVFTDITEQHRRREHESAMRDELERVRHLESLGRLSGGIAHDFRNVLAAVDINTELLAARVEPDAQRYINVIQRASGRAAEMVRQLLSFAERDLSETGIVDVNQAVVEIEALLRSSVSATISLELDLDSLPCTTRAARGDLDRLILNLVCNARDALPLGGIIRVATVRGRGEIPTGSAPSEWVQLIVADNGVGIPEDIIAKVFDPFFTTKGDSGSGLGLASVHGIVSSLGGHVAIASRYGSGTTVTVALPPEERGAPRGAVG